MKERLLQRGDIITVDLGKEGVGYEKQGVRPCIVISNELMSKHSGNIIIAPMTNANHKRNKNGEFVLLPTQVLLSNDYYRSLEFSSILQLEDIRSISKERVIKYIGYVSIQTQSDINTKLYNMLLN